MTKNPALMYSKEHATTVAMKEFRVNFNCKEFSEVIPSYYSRRVDETTKDGDIFSAYHPVT